VPQLRNVLDRFRPAGTPGAAGRPGIPADRSSEAAAELTEVLALLDDAQEEAARTRQAATDRAQQIRRAAQRQAAELVAKGRHDADRVRAQSEADVLRDADADEDNMRCQTEVEIAQLRRQADERLAQDADTVAAAARGWLDALVRSTAVDSKAESDR